MRASNSHLLKPLDSVCLAVQAYLYVIRGQYHDARLVAIGTTVVGGGEHRGHVWEGEHGAAVVCEGIAHTLCGTEEGSYSNVVPL